MVTGVVNQAGAMTESVYGGYFKDDEGGLALKHNRKGLISMANIGEDTNSSHFSIIMSPSPHLVCLSTANFGKCNLFVSRVSHDV